MGAYHGGEMAGRRAAGREIERLHEQIAELEGNVMTPEDQSIIFDIAQAAMDGCNWPALRDRLLEVASEEALNRAWMALATEVGRDAEPLMAE